MISGNVINSVQQNESQLGHNVYLVPFMKSWKQAIVHQTLDENHYIKMQTSLHLHTKQSLNFRKVCSLGKVCNMQNLQTNAMVTPPSRMAIFMKWSRIWWSCGSYGVYVAVTGSTWLLRGVHGCYGVYMATFQ